MTKTLLIATTALLMSACMPLAPISPSSDTQPLFLNQNALESTNGGGGGIRVTFRIVLFNWEHEDYEGEHIRVILHDGSPVQLDLEHHGAQVLGWAYLYGEYDEEEAREILEGFVERQPQGFDLLYFSNDTEDMHQFNYHWMGMVVKK